MIVIALILSSSIGWFVSTLAGGGSPFILLPVLGSFLGASAVPPVLTLGMLMGNSQRVWLYWREIDWRVMGWYLPGAIVGSGLGAFVFTRLQLEWLPLLLAGVLILSTLGYGGDRTEQSFPVQAWYFLPAGFLFAFLSGLVGSTGPILNPLYLNYGLVKEPMIATKSANVVVVHLAKIIAYAAFGAFTLPYVGYGLIVGLAALPGNWLGQKVLKQISPQGFRQLVMVFVALSGMLIFGQEMLARWGQ